MNTPWNRRRVYEWDEGRAVADLILGPMLRHVTETSATIWIETDRRCVVTILGHEVATFCVAGHHYALAIIEELTPARVYEYDVQLDGEVRWPMPGSVLPPSRIRTLGHGRAPRILFGSCRAAAPHEPPYALELAFDPRGRGVDALYAYATHMVDQPAQAWPDLVIFLGDQIYADEPSPAALRRIGEHRKDPNNAPSANLPPGLVGGFEEYTMLYHESWSAEFERWFLSNVPSVMTFDDHEMIDDWNISELWVADIRRHDWWQDHVIGGLMSYWLYQHLGNLSPDVIRSEGILADLGQVEDGYELLHAWAMKSEEFTPIAGGYRFTFHRDIGRVRLVMIDDRNARVLTRHTRQMVDDDEWKWIVDSCHADVDHLLIGTSLPVFVPGGLHDLQVFSEALCDGAWGWPGRKFGEWVRRKADMEDWPAFIRSFDAFVELLRELADSSRSHAPATISVLSGDIHFSYAAEIRFIDGHTTGSRIHQLVSSPIRNALKPPESTAMRLGTSRLARHVGRLLRRTARRRHEVVEWKLDGAPVFGNSLGQLVFDGRAARLSYLRTRPHDKQSRPTLDLAIELDLVTVPEGGGG